MEGKITFIGRERSCHLVLKGSRVLGFLSLTPPLHCLQIAARHFHGEQCLFADMLGQFCGQAISCTSIYLAAIKFLTGPRCLAILARITVHLCVFPQSPFSPTLHLHCPLAPVHFTSCSHQLCEEAESW